MKNIFLVVCLILPQLMMAQVGYLGKKFDFQYSPSIGNPWLGHVFDVDEENSYPRHNKLEHEKNLPINVKHRFQLNMAVTEKITLGVGYNFYKTGFRTFGISVPNEDSTFTIAIPTSGNIEAREIVFRLTYYKGEMAPIGRYFAWELGRATNKVYQVPKGSSTHYDESTEKKTFIAIDLGQNILIRNRLFLKLGGSMQWGAGYTIGTNYGERLILYHTGRFTVGFGYLLF